MHEESDIARLQRMQERGSGSSDAAACTVYVKNLDTSVNNADIAAHFRACGQMSAINVVGKSIKKYAVIDFTSEWSVEISLSLSGSVLKGKKIVVQRKKDFNKRP